MTFPIRPVPPFSAVPKVRDQEDPKRAAEAMEQNPQQATTLLSGLLLHIDNVDASNGAGSRSTSALVGTDAIRRFVAGTQVNPTPSRESFARLLISVRDVETELRGKMALAGTEGERHVLWLALRTTVAVKRFRGT
ncbi:hypothetical protein [uncultured Stenotrophomonas sp.]|uniref:hypothetical protein n=1 Tax=uncultured Stenotrophomonas sp. TaxID=165438 RepID=UPI0028E982F8|nr:hypothetical protein [uncultured Stenotrophomonas sp.]